MSRHHCLLESGGPLVVSIPYILRNIVEYEAQLSDVSKKANGNGRLELDEMNPNSKDSELTRPRTIKFWAELEFRENI
jgi:hypothetical protein